MRPIYKTIIFSLLVFTGTSCSDFLDKQPHTLTPETYFNNEAELQTFLTGVYSPLMQEPFYGGDYLLTNGGGDDLSFYQRSNPTDGIICNNANSGNASVMKFWRLLYDGINRANMLLENVDKNNTIPQTVRDRVKAEALFLRSFYYFNLIQGWGDVPMRLATVTSPDNLSLARTPKQELYNQLIKDINAAIPALYTADQLPYTGRVTQSAAKAILARIYMFRAGENFRDNAVGNTITNSADSVRAYFTHARDLCLDIKNSGLHGLVKPYSSIFVDMCTDKYHSAVIRESIWEAEEAGNRSTPDQAAGRAGNTFGFGCTVDYSTVSAYASLKGMGNPGFSYKFIYATSKLFEMYESEGDTARCDWNIAPYEYTYASAAPKQVTGRQYYFGKKPASLTTVEGLPVTTLSQASSDANKTRCDAKFRRELEIITPKNKNFTSINVPIIHYSDVLLMLAEAENEINDNPTDVAYLAMDEVRNRAGISPLTGSALSKKDFRLAVKKERAMELCFEGIRRWDLIRWGNFHTAMNEIPGYVARPGWGTNYKYAENYFKVSPYYNYFPIPDMEMSVNKLIVKNNPGW